MADTPVGSAWPVEDIPDRDELYLRVPRRIWQDAFRKAKLEPSGVSPSWFRGRDHESIIEISCDWERYATPEETRVRTNPNPTANAVLAIHAGDVRAFAAYDVVHSPDPVLRNRAHSDIRGPVESHPRARVIFARTARVVLELPPSDDVS